MSRFYLVNHRPRQTQYRARRDRVSGLIVVHTAESAPDTVADDTGAEGVASFIANRSDYGGYHRIADSDSVVPMIGFDMAVFGDGTGSNEFAIHVSFATQAHRWPDLPKDWVEGALRNGAKAVAEAMRWLKDEHGITVPIKRISRAESEARKPGLISHAERDPGRRSDPGPEFPWDRFMQYIKEEMGEDEMNDTQERKLDEVLATTKATDRKLTRYLGVAHKRNRELLRRVNKGNVTLAEVTAELAEIDAQLTEALAEDDGS